MNTAQQHILTGLLLLGVLILWLTGWAGKLGMAVMTSVPLQLNLNPLSGDGASLAGAVPSSTPTDTASTFTGSASTLNATDRATIASMGYPAWVAAHNAAIVGGARGYTYNPVSQP